MIKDKLKILRRPSVLLVYQMGKVGSSTIENSIPGALHFHTLFRNPPCPPRFALRRKGLRALWGWVKDFIIVLFLKTRAEVKIITLIREPIRRNVSMLFQDYPYWYVDFMGEGNKTARSDNAGNVLDIYKHKFPHRYALEWFDKELKRLTGIDVYDFPYEIDKGFCFYSRRNFKVLLLEMEKINKNWPILEDFVGRRLDRVDVNSGGNKWYAPIYEKNKMDLYSLSDINRISFDSKFYKKFYMQR